MTNTINEAGLDIIKTYEGLELEAYQDDVGIWTIGFGHTGNVHSGDTINEAQADRLLNEDVQRAEKIVRGNVRAELSSNQFSALVSFVFNVGPGKKNAKDGFVVLKNGQPSTMLRLLNEGLFEAAAEEFKKWNKAGGVPLRGLTLRRAAERALFCETEENS